MPTTKSERNKSNRGSIQKYNTNNYDRLEVKVKKGEKEIILAHAEKFQPEIGEFRTIGYSPKGSVNAFINRAITETIERDKAKAGE